MGDKKLITGDERFIFNCDFCGLEIESPTEPRTDSDIVRYLGIECPNCQQLHFYDHKNEEFVDIEIL